MVIRMLLWMLSQEQHYHLSAEPVLVLLIANFHWYVAHLGNMCNPRTLKNL